MENINFSKLKKSITNFNNMSENDKIENTKKINDIWRDVIKTFNNVCKKDEKLVNLYKQIDDIKQILNYDIRENFKVYSHTFNEGDYEFEEDFYVFSKELLDKYKNLYDNWDSIKKETEYKITKIKNSKFSLFKKSKIEKLSKDLENKEEMVEYYKNCKDKKEKRIYYEKNKEKLLNPLVKKFEKIVKKYATDVVLKELDKNPNIICVEHNNRYHVLPNQVSFDAKFINDICNNIRDHIQFEISNTAVKEFESNKKIDNFIEKEN